MALPEEGFSFSRDVGFNRKACAGNSIANLFWSRWLVRAKPDPRDTTQKFLFTLRDNTFIESVLIPASPALYGSPSDRKTLCVSTQVGSAPTDASSVRAVWRDGLRNLEPGEIVEQVLLVETLSGETVQQYRLHGNGGTLGQLSKSSASHRDHQQHLGASESAHATSRFRRVALANRIRELADQPLQIRLAVSLHGATDEVRQTIMPINRKFNLADVDRCVRILYVQRNINVLRLNIS